MTERTTVTTRGVFLIFPIALGLVLSGCSRNSHIVRKADALMRKGLLEYSYGSFESATNALLSYTAYLDANEQRIASYRDYDAVDLNGQNVPFPLKRDIPVTQFTPHAMLACMMVYSGETNAALDHLSRAFSYHVQIRTRAQMSPVSKGDFVQFLLEGRNKIDSETGAAWKRQFKLDTNVVGGIAAAWMRQHPSED